MEPKIFTIFITAGATIIVALIGLVTSILANQKGAKVSLELEKIKFKLEREKQKKQIHDTEDLQSINSLKLMIKSIQIVKNQLQLILSAFQESLDSKSSIDLFFESRTNLIRCYEENFINLSKEEERLSHDVKKKF